MNEGRSIKMAIIERMAQCKLSLNEAKTKIVYSKDDDRKERHESTRPGNMRIPEKVTGT